MAGKLYGIGVGPGDPELMTLKAVRILKECDVIAAPGKIPKETIAYRIAHGACPGIDGKTAVGIHMPMTKDKTVLEERHREGVRILRELLDSGKNTAFLTLGDPTVYSTYMYLHGEIQSAGYETEIVNGVPSFCAAAAKIPMSIAGKEEQIHIIPASYQIEEALQLSGTRILMKAGKKIPDVKRVLKEREDDVILVENCGMERERIVFGAEQIPEDAGYYTLLFVKDKKKENQEPHA